MQRHEALALNDLPDGGCRVIRLGERAVGIFRIGAEYRAYFDFCPHAGAPVCGGPLVGTVLTCPWHGWQFDVLTGQHVTHPGVTLDACRVEVEGDALFVWA